MFLPPNDIDVGKFTISQQFLFHTPLFEIELDNVDNNLLIEKIYELREDDKEGVTKSNMGGWHSKFRDDTDGVETFFELFKELGDILLNLPFDPKITEIENLDAWAMINKRNSWNQLHNHLFTFGKARCDLSGVYYVKVPEGDCGDILFRNPVPAVVGNSFMMMRYHANKEWERRFPKTGFMYIFPAFLDHMVLPNNTDEDRISISFNMTVS
tara:strand:- start:532 stop:1167 length:636 start_codon:yes stop_codon:yes gene_type:complete